MTPAKFRKILEPKTGHLPAWMCSPPTPAEAPQVEADAEGRPPADRSEVVEVGGRLFDRATLYHWHHYAPPQADGSGRMLAAFLRDWWRTYDTDKEPGNRERRAEVLALAKSTVGGVATPAAERRRAWRLVDHLVRAEAPAVFTLAGFEDLAELYRLLPPISGPVLPRGAAHAFRLAFRATDRATSAALRGRRPYAREDVRRRGQERSHRLELAAGDEVPGMARHLRANLCTGERPGTLERGLEAMGHAWLCIRRDPRVKDAEVERVQHELEAGTLGLVREMIALGRATARSAA